MKTHTEYLTFRTRKKREYINITGQVAQALERSGIREGMALFQPCISPPASGSMTPKMG